MKKWLILGLLIISAPLLASCKQEEPKPEPTPTPYCKICGYEYNADAINDYNLVWSDEFDYEGLPESSKWDYDTGGSGFGNNELQYYTNNGNNAWVDGEKLIIEAKKEAYTSGDRTWNYTSARLVTRNKAQWKYGKIQVNAKVPTGRGSWPAIWMLPTNYIYGAWPNSGEIDIMEHVGYDPNRIHGSIHTQAYNQKINTQKGGSKVVSDATAAFHVYEIEWFPDQILFKIDGVTYYRYRPLALLAQPKNAHWPFDNPFHLLLNIAVGGDWGAVQGIDNDSFPWRMEVDYVRVYQSPTVQSLRRNQ
ncbi:glycoside hydrolase family 16 protein [Acholeplasma vituli]|uniref:Glycoside hydrolase family 16 protein n=1 Tax=Paracholeplasma vituli TaxID=69473 RepID=A0ABT2PUR2_9MOLU|nr:glycoside hydrolase family 16 protein [Paracholeplasma vituli]MCU0104691.1 glycoside hydrolase family 16 protein [Paracholeplasma vituli]